MNIRKNIYTLTDAQLQDYKDAVNAIKTYVDPKARLFPGHSSEKSG